MKPIDEAYESLRSGEKSWEDSKVTGAAERAVAAAEGEFWARPVALARVRSLARALSCGPHFALSDRNNFYCTNSV